MGPKGDAAHALVGAVDKTLRCIAVRNVGLRLVIRLHGLGVGNILRKSQAAIAALPDHKLLSAYGVIFQCKQWVDGAAAADRALRIMNTFRHKRPAKLAVPALKAGIICR